MAEHALACPTHRLTRAQAAAGAPGGPALTLTHHGGSGVLRSNGVPVWHDAHGDEQDACSTSWHPTAPSGPAPTLRAFLPLRGGSGGDRQLIDVLRGGRDLHRHWLVIHPHGQPGEVIGCDSVRVLDHREDIAPPGARWRPRIVSSPQVGGWSYPALAAVGYTTSWQGLICRFDSPTARLMAADLDGPWRLSTMPGEYPRLRFDGNVLVVLEEHDSGDDIRLHVVDRCLPDRDGYYSIGAHLWLWQASATNSSARPGGGA